MIMTFKGKKSVVYTHMPSIFFAFWTCGRVLWLKIYLQDGTAEREQKVLLLRIFRFALNILSQEGNVIFTVTVKIAAGWSVRGYAL